LAGVDFKEKKMKKIIFGLALVFALSLAGCGSTPRSGSTSRPESKTSSVTVKGLSGVPSFVNEAYINASEDVLIGIGTYKIGNDMSKMGVGKTFAETRARADISRQLDTIVKDMVNDYAATSELDPDAAVSFQENITQNLSKAELRGAKVVRLERDDNGLLWVVMEYDKAAAAELDQAASAARLAVPAAAAFNALERMNTAFDKEAGGGPVPVGE
jgi:hypothetical protein